MAQVWKGFAHPGKVLWKGPREAGESEPRGTGPQPRGTGPQAAATLAEIYVTVGPILQGGARLQDARGLALHHSSARALSGAWCPEAEPG